MKKQGKLDRDLAEAFAAEDSVTVVGGTFEGFKGTVIKANRSTVEVRLDIFGRITTVSLEAHHLRRI